MRRLYGIGHCAATIKHFEYRPVLYDVSDGYDGLHEIPALMYGADVIMSIIIAEFTQYCPLQKFSRLCTVQSNQCATCIELHLAVACH
jgi:hypothetical protein